MDFNEVIKRLLGEGVAYDAISVGSYAHRYRRYWQNLIPGPLLHEMVEKRFLMRSVDQQVQDVLEHGRFAQTCQHNRSPGPHTVNIPGRPLKAFATFVTVADSHAYSAEAEPRPWSGGVLCSRSCGTGDSDGIYERYDPSCNDRGPYHWTTAAKRMQRHFLAAELLYL
jgi:hypothetical protein